MAEEVIAKVYVIVCTACNAKLRLHTPRQVPCHISTVCPHCETVLRRDVLEESIPELRSGGVTGS